MRINSGFDYAVLGMRGTSVESRPPIAPDRAVAVFPEPCFVRTYQAVAEHGFDGGHDPLPTQMWAIADAEAHQRAYLLVRDPKLASEDRRAALFDAQEATGLIDCGVVVEYRPIRHPSGKRIFVSEVREF